MKDMMQYLTQRAAQKVQQDNERIRRGGQSSKRTSAVILEDTSGSTKTEGKIGQIDQGSTEMLRDLQNDRMTRNGCDLAEITFNDVVQVQTPFTPVSEYPQQREPLTAEGGTHIGEAVLKALELIDEQQEYYSRNQIPHYCPILWIMSDGNSWGEDPAVLMRAIAETTRRIRSGQLKVYAIAVGSDADLPCLTALAGGAEPLQVGDHEIVKAMHEVSSSVISASRDVEYLLSHAARHFTGE